MRGRPPAGARGFTGGPGGTALEMRPRQSAGRVRKGGREDTTISDKVCVVTGVGKGNGRSIAGRFAREGYRVVMLARTRQALDRSEAVEMAQA